MNYGTLTLLAGLLGFLGGYLVGAVPSGLLIGKGWKGVDLRTVGSGNIGFTNAWRQLGAGPGLAILLADVLKAFAAVWFLPPVIDEKGGRLLALVVAVGVILGNTVNVFIKFKGGKGIASGLGVFLALAPAATGVAFGVFAILLAITRYMSLASLLAAYSLTVAAWFFEPRPIFALGVAISVWVTWRHRENIQRLRNGTERRFGKPGSERAA